MRDRTACPSRRGGAVLEPSRSSAGGRREVRSRRKHMMRKRIVSGALVALGLALSAIVSIGRVQAQGGGGVGTLAVDADDIGGIVTSAKGPEAGVWVIAETKSLPTGYRKIVVTDDRGRYLVPDLQIGRASCRERA